MEDLSAKNVLCWEGRPKRTTRAPKTYWEEYVETDTWYHNKLLEDVPLDEIQAACFDDDCEDDEQGGEEGDEDENDIDAISSDDSFISDDSVSTSAGEADFVVNSDVDSVEEDGTTEGSDSGETEA